jgi:hypothetical protein
MNYIPSKGRIKYNLSQLTNRLVKPNKEFKQFDSEGRKEKQQRGMISNNPVTENQ